MKKFFVFLFFPVLCFSQTNFDKVESLFQEKSYIQAEQILAKYLKNNSKDLEAIEYYGDAFGFQEKWDPAIIEYKKLVEAKPKEANYHYKYGGVLAMKALQVNKLKALSLISDVKEAFLTAAQLDKNHIDTRWALVELYMQLPGIIGGSKSTSLKYANELEVISKVDGYLSKGYIYEYDDEPALAEKYYKLAITEGGSITCFEKLTNFYEKNNEPEKALATMEASQAKHQRNALHYQIGKVAAEYNIQLNKGAKCLFTYIENYSPKDGVPKGWAHYRLAQIFKHQSNKGNALKHIDLALLELPNIDVFKAERQNILKL
jgi:tetratricopeptide (TPR) repeat protein